MRVLFVTSECFPLVKTGGLADVSAALPLALVQVLSVVICSPLAVLVMVFATSSV